MSSKKIPYNPLSSPLAGRAQVAAVPLRTNKQRAVAAATSKALPGSKGRSLNACRTTGSQEWYTPKPILDALGTFDLDPCAPLPGNRPYTIASTVFTVVDDGLAQTWPADLFAWVNPPYGPEAGKFLAKLANHAGGGIALVFARTDTAWAQDHALAKASAILFLRGRISFWDASGKPGAGAAGAPSMLVAYGAKAVERLEKAVLCGKLKGELMVRHDQPRPAVISASAVSANDDVRVAA